MSDFQRPRTRRTTLRNEVLKADPEFVREDARPVEYEFSSHKLKEGKRLFRGYYKSRGAYAD